MSKRRVLFVERLCGDSLGAQSAGIEPSSVNPLAVAVMREVRIDLADKKTKSVFGLFKAGERFNYVVTVCDETSAERCPIFPGFAERLHWSFADPAAFKGSWDQKLEKTRVVRDAIRAQIEAWCTTACPRVA
ncbi:MAG: arsenate reductase ArsC [Candidatus Eremiobacteraeota bacterium]|nr:arsenate reductase ArsC [Candidatus Eremiobacteraeota bacterium]